ncbi:MAG TPA: NUDIX hydrolase [bacterium]|jgi:ADP-ribose pyrophosphatase
MPVGERTIRSTRIYEGRVVSLRVDEVVLPSGRSETREIVEHRGAVAIVARAADGNVLLVRQYRAPAGRRLLEIPAGTLEPDETVEACAQRELAEEVGMHAGRWRALASIFPSPGFLTEIVHVFVADDLTPHALPAEEEEMDVVSVPLADARRMVMSGEICDAKSVTGILLAASVPEGAS